MTAPLDARRQPAARLTRRQLLQAGGIGALTIGLPGTVAASVEAGRGLSGGAADRSCIFVLLCGGPPPTATPGPQPRAPPQNHRPHPPNPPHRPPGRPPHAPPPAPGP